MSARLLLHCFLLGLLAATLLGHSVPILGAVDGLMRGWFR